MADCPHEDFHAAVDVNRLEDTGGFIVDVRIYCRQCQLPFSFVGFPAGLSFGRPMVSVDATELHLPIEPGPQPLNTDLRFEMPAALKRN